MFFRRYKIWEVRAKRWKEKAEETYQRAAELSKQVSALQMTNHNLQAQLDSANHERELLERLMGRVAEQNSSMMARVDTLFREVVELARRPPHVIDLSESISKIGETITGILNGGLAPADEDGAQKTTNSRLSMDELGLDNMAGVKPGEWYPDHEYDDFAGDMENWPKVGEWTAHTPQTSSLETEVRHQIVGDRVVRTDGTAMFTAGQTGPPPVGGWE